MKQPAAVFTTALALGTISLLRVAGAQADPIEIRNCETIEEPGSYKLVNNLTAPPILTAW
jgi:hypothetical protein